MNEVRPRLAGKAATPAMSAMPHRLAGRTRQLVGSIRASQFLRYNLVAFVGAVSVSTLNYLYYPVIGRVMTPGDFGEVQVVSSLLMQSIVLLDVFNVVTVCIVAKYRDPMVQERLISEWQRIAWGASAFAILGLLALGSWLGSFLRFDSPLPLLGLLVAVALSVPATFRVAYLNGQRDFAAWARLLAVPAAGKLVFGLILVVLGWRTMGAVAGIVLAQGLALWYATTQVRRYGWRRRPLRWGVRPDLRLVRPELAFAGLVLVTNLGLTVFLSIDILAVKHWFDPTDAGRYAGVSTLSRTIFFVNASVAGVLLPSIRAGQSAADHRRFLYRSLVLTAAIGLAGLAAFTAAPRLAVMLLMGPNFLAYAGLLPRLALFAFLVSLLNLIVTYHLARRRFAVGWAVAVGLACLLVFVGRHHATPPAVVDSVIAGTVVTLGLVAGLGLLTARRLPWRQGPGTKG